MKKAILFLLILSANVNGQNAPAIVLPFIIDNGRMVVELESSYGNVNLMLDTGSKISFIDSAYAVEKNMTFGYKISMNHLLGRRHCYEVQEPGIAGFSNVNWLITNYKNSHDTCFSVPIHGLLGIMGLMEENRVVIDFDKKEVALESCFDGGYSETAITERMYPLFMQANLMAHFISDMPCVYKNITIHCEKLDSIEFIVDTGCRFPFAVIVEDSVKLNSVESIVGVYTNVIGEPQLQNYTVACIHEESPFCSEEIPLFISDDSSVGRNRIYGLLGLPYLLQWKKIVIDWPGKKMMYYQ